MECITNNYEPAINLIFLAFVFVVVMEPSKKALHDKEDKKTTKRPAQDRFIAFVQSFRQ